MTSENRKDEKNSEVVAHTHDHDHGHEGHVHGPNCNHGHHHHHHEPLKPIVRDAPKVGRNDPCVCGSGKKFKKCCGN